MPEQLILLGVIGRAHGVRGRVRVTSHTADPAALTEYGPLSTSDGRRFTLRWKSEGVAEVFDVTSGEQVKVADRAQAERLTNTKLFIERERLPAPEDDEFYLADLIGLTAVDAGGAIVGTISVVHDYGAGVSLEIIRENAASLLLPFTMACVPDVSIAAGRVTIAPPDEVVVAEDAGTSNGGHAASDGPVEPGHDEGGASAAEAGAPGAEAGAPGAEAGAPGAEAADGLGNRAKHRHGAARPRHRTRHDARIDGTSDEDIGAAA